MSNTFLPKPITELLSLGGTVLPVWTANAASVGVLPADCVAMTAARTKLLGDYQAALDLRSQSKAATVKANDSADDLRTLMQRAVDKIRLFAQASANPSAVFTLAQVPAPSGPSPLPAPEAPKPVSADPNFDGTVTVSWKGSQAGGAFFSVWRKVGESGTWTQIGAVAAKKFMDFNVPSPVTSGGATLFYAVRTQRNTEVSELSEPATITYGNGPGFAAVGSSMTAFNTQSGKLAA